MWFIIIIIVLVILILLSNKFKKDDDIKKEKGKENGILYSSKPINFIRYLGGFPEISANKDMFSNIQIKTDRIFIQIPSKHIEKEILISNVLDAECNTIDQVSKDISLGRMIVFGFWALGMKKTKEKIITCAVITYKDEFDKKRSLVFQMKNPDEMIKTILDLKRNINVNDKKG